MGRLRTVVVEWWPVAILIILGVHAALGMTGKLGPTYRWLHDHVSPAGWSALAAWTTVCIAFGTATFASIQVREARRTREERAQPNVVMYSELNPFSKQFLEIVVKNFGATPAYNVKITITPPLTSTPNLISGDKLFEVPIPEFLILAPGQEWRTGWDHSVARKRYQEKWNRIARTTESERTENEELERQYWTTRQIDDTTTEQRLYERFLPSRYEAIVTYEDSHRKKYTTESILDSDQYEGTTWVSVKTVHHLTKMLDDHLKDHTKALDAIHRRLAEFGTEHEGVWFYGSGDEDERQYRRELAEAEAEQQRRFEKDLGLCKREESGARDAPEDETEQAEEEHRE